MALHLDTTYPIIARWVMEYSWIEIGQDDMRRSFVRALDEGGLVWEGQEDYATLDDALSQLSGRALARAALGWEFPISALSIAERGPRPALAHVSCTLSKIPYGGFSPVRLQAEGSP